MSTKQSAHRSFSTLGSCPLDEIGQPIFIWSHHTQINDRDLFCQLSDHMVCQNSLRPCPLETRSALIKRPTNRSSPSFLAQRSSQISQVCLASSALTPHHARRPTPPVPLLLHTLDALRQASHSPGPATALYFCWPFLQPHEGTKEEIAALLRCDLLPDASTTTDLLDPVFEIAKASLSPTDTFLEIGTRVVLELSLFRGPVTLLASHGTGVILVVS
jgi:hypothetical protein